MELELDARWSGRVSSLSNTGGAAPRHRKQFDFLQLK